MFNLTPCNGCTIPAVLEALKLTTVKGCYAEFGVFRGGSFNAVLQQLELENNYITECFGFDSFEGFDTPKHSMENMYPKGVLSDTDYDVVCNKLAEGHYKTKFKLTKGYFNVSLLQTKITPISVCLVDCDAYTPTQLVMDYVKTYMQNNSIIVFDDYHLADSCQKKAVEEFISANKNIQLEFIKEVVSPDWHVPIYRWKA